MWRLVIQPVDQREQRHRELEEAQYQETIDLEWKQQCLRNQAEDEWENYRCRETEDENQYQLEMDLQTDRFYPRMKIWTGMSKHDDDLDIVPELHTDSRVFDMKENIRLSGRYSRYSTWKGRSFSNVPLQRIDRAYLHIDDLHFKQSVCRRSWSRYLEPLLQTCQTLISFQTLQTLISFQTSDKVKSERCNQVVKRSGKKRRTLVNQSKDRQKRHRIWILGQEDQEFQEYQE